MKFKILWKAILSLCSMGMQMQIQSLISMQQVRLLPMKSIFTNDIEAYSTFSLVGDEVWEYNQFFNGNAAMGAFKGADAENNDWLVSPSIDLTDLTESELRFHHSHKLPGCSTCRNT
jgi:hypothetical protein